MAAAASDYVPKNTNSRKIKSDKKELILRLVKAPKIIDYVKKTQKDTFLIGFKAETNVSTNELVKLSKKRLIESDADVIIANDIGRTYNKNTNYNKVIIIDSKSVTNLPRAKKEKIAKIICKNIEKRI